MTDKQKLHSTCLTQFANRIKELENMAASIADSRNNETKSSAGDKYETSRAMMQMEEDKVVAQLELARQTQSQLRQLSTEPIAGSIRLGCLVKTKLRYYYLSVGLGKVAMEDKTYYCISTDSPIGRLILGKQPGDSIEFNGQRDEIVAFS